MRQGKRQGLRVLRETRGGRMRRLADWLLTVVVVLTILAIKAWW